MSDRPTPRTDAVRFRVGESDHWAVHEVYSKQLERELADARELVEMYKEAKASSPQYSERRDLEKQLNEALEEGEEQARLLGMSGEREAGLLAEVDRLKRELAETVACMRLAEAATIRALHERNEARGQLDLLAESCRWAQVKLGKHTRPSPIDKALAELKVK